MFNRITKFTLCLILPANIRLWPKYSSLECINLLIFASYVEWLLFNKIECKVLSIYYFAIYVQKQIRPLTDRLPIF